MPTADLVVTAYNQATYLPALLESLLAQSLVDWRAVVVDDGSEDDSAAVIDRYAARDGRIRRLSQANGGPARARNAGAALLRDEACSPYIAFIDGDDLLEPDFLRVLSGYLDSRPEVGSVSCGFRKIGPDGEDLGPGHRTRRAPDPVLPRDLPPSQPETPFVAFYCGTGQIASTLHRRSVYDQTQGWRFHVVPHEDTDFFCQMALKARMHAIADCLYVNRRHGLSIIASGPATRSPHFRSDAYHRFRRRWCLWQAADAREEALLREAHSYYMRWFRPLRDLAVAGRALREGLSSGRGRHLRWSFFLLRRLSGDVLRYHVLRRRPDRAGDVRRFPLDVGTGQ